MYKVRSGLTEFVATHAQCCGALAVTRHTELRVVSCRVVSCRVMSILNVSLMQTVHIRSVRTSQETWRTTKVSRVLSWVSTVQGRLAGLQVIAPALLTSTLHGGDWPPSPPPPLPLYPTGKDIPVPVGYGTEGSPCSVWTPWRWGEILHCRESNPAC
jgi:hypothetical protein